MGWHSFARSASLAVAFSACSPSDQGRQPEPFVRPTQFEETGVFQTPNLTESSGVAASRQHPGYLWTHNDSGDEPVVYLTDLSGANLGKLALTGARARDWEDITVGVCPDSPAQCIYLADTGDNSQRRLSARIYVAREPTEVPLKVESLPTRHIELIFDRPFNIEAAATHPSGDLWLISKGLQDTSIFAFRITRSELTHDSIKVKPLLEMDFDPAPTLGQLVTGAAISSDGSVLVARTYTQIFYYGMDRDRLTRQFVCWLGPREPQGEAVDFLDESRLVLTSESEKSGRAPIHVVSCRPGL